MVIMHKMTYKYRLYPTNKQFKLMESMLEECRWLYNRFLEQRKNMWESEQKSLTLYDQIKELPRLKQERESLGGVYSQVLQNVGVRIDLAFKAFFRRVKSNEKPGYPRFRGKGWYNSFTYAQAGFKITEDGKMYISKIGNIKIKIHRQLQGRMKTCTIKRSSTGKWYVTLSCVDVPSKQLELNGESVGVDVGINSFAVLSDGSKIENPRFFKTEEKSLAKAQRKLSKCEKDTPERIKRRKVVARVHERIWNRRDDFTHKVSRRIVNEYGIICVEDLHIRNMISNKQKVRLAKSIQDVAWGEFFNKLLYKAENAGKTVVKVNPAYTSQDCSECGTRKVVPLSERVYDCGSCGLNMDRDHNAARNVLRLGIQSLGENP